jgi:E-phenylitaconyl-CoA hydratase
MSVTVTSHGWVSLITLDRAEARNALSLEMRDELERALAAFEADGDKRVAVLTGAGDKAFCAGADLAAGSPPSRGVAAQLDRGNRSLVRDLDLSKPLIAAINGMALGGGLELALLCDIRIASRTATFALPEVKIGSMPGSGGTQRLPRSIAVGHAMLLALSGERITADEALQMGLVSRVVESADLLSATMQVAERIADNAPLAVRMTRKAIREGMELPLAQGLALERTLFNLIRDTEDRAEGRNAFREKRKPVFKGR